MKLVACIDIKMTWISIMAMEMWFPCHHPNDRFDILSQDILMLH